MDFDATSDISVGSLDDRTPPATDNDTDVTTPRPKSTMLGSDSDTDEGEITDESAEPRRRQRTGSVTLEAVADANPEPTTVQVDLPEVKQSLEKINRRHRRIGHIGKSDQQLLARLSQSLQPLQSKGRSDGLKRNLSLTSAQSNKLTSVFDKIAVTSALETAHTKIRQQQREFETVSQMATLLLAKADTQSQRAHRYRHKAQKLQTRVSALSSERTKDRRSLRDSHRRIGDLESQLKQLEEQLKTSQEDLRKSQNTQRHLTSTIEASDDINSQEVQSLETRLSEVEHRSSLLERQNISLNTALQEHKADIAERDAEIETLRAQVQRLEKVEAKFQDMTQIKETLRQKEAYIRDILWENQTLLKSVHELRDETERLQKDSFHDKSLYQSLTQEIDFLREQLAAAEAGPAEGSMSMPPSMALSPSFGALLSAGRSVPEPSMMSLADELNQDSDSSGLPTRQNSEKDLIIIRTDDDDNPDRSSDAGQADNSKDTSKDAGAEDGAGSDTDTEIERQRAAVEAKEPLRDSEGNTLMTVAEADREFFMLTVLSVKINLLAQVQYEGVDVLSSLTNEELFDMAKARSIQFHQYPKFIEEQILRRWVNTGDDGDDAEEEEATFDPIDSPTVTTQPRDMFPRSRSLNHLPTRGSGHLSSHSSPVEGDHPQDDAPSLSVPRHKPKKRSWWFFGSSK